MKKRPTSVTVIAWILIVLGGISLITSTLMITNPMTRDMMSQSPIPISVQFAMMYIGSLITLVASIAMLKGHNWARLLYMIWNVVGLVVSFATSPMKAAMIPSLVVFIIIAFFLFRLKANIFFSTEERSGNA